MPRFRVCRSFTVESGHMLSKHPEDCRFPHGHTRRVEVVVSAETLDARDMVVDFKALKLAVQQCVDRYDHRMALNSNDPLRADIERIHPGSTVVFENQDPTTEVMAAAIYESVQAILAAGFSAEPHYHIPAGTLTLERIRVWETPTSWAEFGD